MKPEYFDLLLERQLDGTLTDTEQQNLVATLERHDWARDRFVARMSLGAELKHRLDAGQKTAKSSRKTNPLPPPPASQAAHPVHAAQPAHSDHPSPKTQTRLSLLAASVLFTIGMIALVLAFISSGDPNAIATLVSSENAAWESALPTTVGSTLPPGTMTLKAGVATIQFNSGAEMTLEAPFELELLSAMRCNVTQGSAILNVPDRAKGFILDTPNGYAVDHGTAFAVSVGKGKQASFEVIEGEISLHAPAGETLFLKENEAASFTDGQIVRDENPHTEGELSAPRGITRLETHGKSRSIIFNNDFDLLHPDFLMVKQEITSNKTYRRRAYFAFDTSNTAKQNWQQATKAKLLFNLVPCGLGAALHLEEINRFAVHGLSGKQHIDWSREANWNDMPPPDDATLLGTFDIPRSQQRGTFGIETDALLSFLKDHSSEKEGDAVFILTRETPERIVSGLVHAFASDSHPEAAGPILEITIP